MKNQKGIGLIEVIAALSVSVVVITALVSLSVFTLRSSLSSKLLLEGTKLSSGEMELVRAVRDASLKWSDSSGSLGFVNSVMPCSSQCYVNASDLSIVEGAQTIGTGNMAVKRFFSVTDANGGGAVGLGTSIVRVSVTAQWGPGFTKSTSLYTDLTNWKNKATQ